MKRTKLKRFSETRKRELDERRENTKERHNWFLDLWDKNELIDHYGNQYVICFETGRRLNRDVYRTNSFCYSHILPKETFPEYEKEEFNVKIVYPPAHHQYSVYPEKAPKQYAEYIKLLDLYKKGEL